MTTYQRRGHFRMQNGNRVWVEPTLCEKRKPSKEITMGFKTGNYLSGIGFILVIVLASIEPMPHSFELFWLHIGSLMIATGMIGAGAYLTWHGK